MSDVCVGVEHVALGGILCDVLAIDNNNGGVCDACIYFECYGYHRDLHVLTHSFPTRRSSDRGLARGPSAGHARWRPPAECRSEEHTSELQSLMHISYAVFCLEKKIVKHCVTIDVLARTPGNNVYVGFMVLTTFTATKCRGLVWLTQVIK